MTAIAASAGERPGEWTGNFAPCDRHSELQKRERMNLGVRFSVSSAPRAGAYVRAMSFWATILDMTWGTVDSRACAVQFIDAGPRRFKPGEAAMAQFPGAASFQGWILLNPSMHLSEREWFLTAVHEIGHLLGLRHSESTSSVMYFVAVDGPKYLDRADLAVLAARHTLRKEVLTCLSPGSDSYRLPAGYRCIREGGSASISLPD
jgi:hypothetical protein